MVWYAQENNEVQQGPE